MINIEEKKIVVEALGCYIVELCKHYDECKKLGLPWKDEVKQKVDVVFNLRQKIEDEKQKLTIP